MVTVVRAAETLRSDGDFPYGSGGYQQFLVKPDWASVEKWCPLDIGTVTYHAWNDLKTHGVDAQVLKTTSAYTCPSMNAKYYAVVPTVVFTEKPESYFPGELKRYYHKERLCDTEWQKGCFGPLEENGVPKLNVFHKLLLGSGFTSFIRPSDGHRSETFYFVTLDNGDWLCCVAWVWYNK